MEICSYLQQYLHIEKCKDSAGVYIPADWEVVVREARPRTPFDVKPMESSQFLDFSELSKQYTRRKKDANKKPVLISKAVWMNFGQAHDPSGELKKHPNEVWLRYSYSSDEPWSKASLLKGRKRLPPSPAVTLPEKYPNGHPMKPKKLDLIPPEHRQFYLDLFATAPRGNSGDSSDDDGEDFTLIPFCSNVLFTTGVHVGGCLCHCLSFDCHTFF